jgi:tetratricopeptide (TPR) repeat protein
MNVAHVLEGSVQKASGQVRITAQLIRADDGFHVWSQSYTKPLEDIFTIQDEIATEVVKALDTSLVGGVDTEALGPATRSVDAYEVYLRALEQQSVFSYASLATAEGLFKRALALDPEFLDARLGLARNHILMHETGLLTLDETRARVAPLLAQVRETHEHHPQARAYELILATVWPVVLTEMTLAERRDAMIELRGLLATIPDDFLLRWRVAEMLEFIENDEQAALEVLQGGLLVDPRSAFLYTRIGEQLREMGRLEEAQAALERAMELDPRQPGIYPRLSRLAAARNDFPGRVRWMRRAVEADPEDHELATALARLLYGIGLTEEGDRWARRVAALVPDSDFVQSLAVARAESREDWSEVMALAGEMIEHRATQREGVFNLAVGAYADAAARLGRAQEAYTFLLSARPEAGDFERPVTDMDVMDLRMYALSLMREFADRDEVIAAWNHAASQLEAFGWEWREEPVMRIFDHVIRSEYEAAVPDALEELSVPLAVDPNRSLFFELPANAPLAQYPQVAARLAERARERQTVRAAVSEMLQEPEWQ